MSDRSQIKELQLGQYGSAGLSNTKDSVNKMHYRSYSVLISDAATAGTAVTETNVAAYVPNACKVVACYVAAPIAVTASDSVYATFTLAKRTAGGSGTTIATQTTKTTGSGGLGSLTALAPYALTTTAANVELAAGDSLTIAVAKASTGTALTAATSYVCVHVIVEEI